MNMEHNSDFSPESKADFIRKKIEKIERKMLEESLSADDEAKALAEIARLESQLQNAGKESVPKKSRNHEDFKRPNFKESQKEKVEQDLLRSAQEKQKKGQKLDLFEARALFKGQK